MSTRRRRSSLLSRSVRHDGGMFRAATAARSAPQMRLDEKDEVASLGIESEERRAAHRLELVLAVQLEIDAKYPGAPRPEHAIVAAGEVGTQ